MPPAAPQPPPPTAQPGTQEGTRARGARGAGSARSRPPLRPAPVRPSLGLFWGYSVFSFVQGQLDSDLLDLLGALALPLRDPSQNCGSRRQLFYLRSCHYPFIHPFQVSPQHNSARSSAPCCAQRTPGPEAWKDISRLYTPKVGALPGREVLIHFTVEGTGQWAGPFRSHHGSQPCCQTPVFSGVPPKKWNPESSILACQTALLVNIMVLEARHPGFKFPLGT